MSTRLFSHNSKLRHLLLIGILITAFSISVMVRSQAADYGFQLNEFDPFFNYRATNYLVQNGLDAYLNWHDQMSWYPDGRDISATSQTMLHFTAAALYSVFGGGMDLYSFTILFPVVFGSLTVVVVFALVRVIAGTTAGLFASLFFALSPAVIVRGTIGWFKSEPLGLFYGLLGAYLLLSGIKSANPKSAVARVIGGGIILAFGLASWGGIQFFVIPIAVLFLGLPFFRNDHKFLMWVIPLFSVTFLVASVLFERPGLSFVTGLGGILIIVPTIVMIAEIFLKRLSGGVRLPLIFLVGVIIATGIILYANSFSQFLPLPSFRYLNAINPFLTTTDPLVDSVAEHATTTLNTSFWFQSVLMIFAGIGVWLLMRTKNGGWKIRGDMMLFALAVGMSGVYISSAFTRLDLYSSLAVIVLSSIGLTGLTSMIMQKGVESRHKKRIFVQGSFVAIIIFFLITPTFIPVQGNWISSVKAPPTILNGGSNFQVATDDWLEAMKWLKENTPEDAVVASWWDYGYWITTLAERTSLADNATISTAQIQKIARMLLSSPDEAWSMLQEMGVDYVLIFIAAQNLNTDPPLYLLNGGGDEQKNYWIIRIADKPVSQFIGPDGSTETQLYWEGTLLGQMTPFTTATYYNIATNQQSNTWSPGFIPLFQKEVKLKEQDDPLRLVYASPSFYKDNSPLIGVFIYEVNKDYVSSGVTPTSGEVDVGVITTNQGQIVMKFRDDVAPKTVDNFKKLANSGFYDGTLFHRIIPGFMIQGGDPTTKDDDRSVWGTGGPDYSIEPEFSDLKHTKYMVSMARGAAIDSAGSQFFIMVGDAPWLDGKYTIFGEVILGQEVVDAIASLETNELDQPVDPEEARITNIQIKKMALP